MPRQHPVEPRAHLPAVGAHDVQEGGEHGRPVGRPERQLQVGKADVRRPLAVADVVALHQPHPGRPQSHAHPAGREPDDRVDVTGRRRGVQRGRSEPNSDRNRAATAGSWSGGATMRFSPANWSSSITVHPAKGRQRRLAMTPPRPILAMQALVGQLCGCQRPGWPILAAAQVSTDPVGRAMVPCGLDQRPSGLPVAGLGDRALLSAPGQLTYITGRRVPAAQALVERREPLARVAVGGHLVRVGREPI
jgi:hypothetical protein